MAARSNLVITDRQPTPVERTFSPDGDDSNRVHLFSEKTTVPLGNPRFSASLKRSGSRFKPSLKLAIPVTQTQIINGIQTPVIVRVAYVELAASFDGVSTEQERKDAIGLMASAIQEDQVMMNDLLTKLSDIW